MSVEVVAERVMVMMPALSLPTTVPCVADGVLVVKPICPLTLNVPASVMEVVAVIVVKFPAETIRGDGIARVIELAALVTLTWFDVPVIVVIV